MKDLDQPKQSVNKEEVVAIFYVVGPNNDIVNMMR
jgi:hypothetical protein